MKKKIYFILSGENLFHPYYFNGLMKEINKNSFKIIGITIPREKFKKGFFYFLKKQLELWGMEGFLFISLTNTLFRLLDYLKIINNLSLKNIADKYMIPVVEIENVNSQEHLNYLKKLKVDIIVSSNGQIFKNSLLKIAKIACINRHTALLPKYGGCMPVFWAMLNNESEYGVSIHYMVEEIDKGDILYQEAIPLNSKHSMFRNYVIAFNVSIISTIKALDNLMKNKIVHKYYPNKKQYFSNPNSENIKSFKSKNKTFNLSDIFFYFRNLSKYYG